MNSPPKIPFFASFIRRFSILFGKLKGPYKDLGNLDESEDSEDDFAHWDEYMKRFHILMKENGWHPFQYGIWPRQRTLKEKKIPEAVRTTLMKLLDIESKPGNWRCLAERLGASYSDVQFLESRNHESPTQHVLNVFETMNKSLTFLRDIFIDFDRHDVVSVLNDEINRCQIGHWSGSEPTLLSTLPQRNRLDP